MDRSQIAIFAIGFGSGLLVGWLSSGFLGRSDWFKQVKLWFKQVKRLAVGARGIEYETHPPLPDVPASESEYIELDIPIDGRWAPLPPNPESGTLPIFRGASELHGKVRVKRGQNIRIFVGHSNTDADLRKLAPLADNSVIQSLVLWGCGHVSGEGFRLLGRFRHVKFLDLSETNFSDADIDPICKLPLKYLNIKACRVSDQAVAKIETALPGCRVDR
jgi:hypothetical protein